MFLGVAALWLVDFWGLLGRLHVFATFLRNPHYTKSLGGPPPIDWGPPSLLIAPACARLILTVVIKAAATAKKSFITLFLSSCL